MQSSSTVHGMSPAENLFRRFKDNGYTPRSGQRDLIQYVSDNPTQPIYNGVFPTGYGKSDLALAIADVLKQQGRINRTLIIVPTDTQRKQYVDGIKESIINIGLILNENVIKVNGEVMPLRAHRENKAEIFVTTVQAITADRNGYYADLMATGKWLIFCDEYQKLNRDEKAKWGKAVDELPDTVKLGMTATPIRSDGKDTVFATKKPDHEVSFEDAYQEQAIRGVVAHVEHYFVDIKDDDGNVERVTTENISDYDLKKDLRLTTKYYASILSSARDCLSVKNMTHPNMHQMLVFAMNVSHAKSVSETLNVLYGSRFSNWIGVGPDGKSSKENTDILDEYKANKLECLVQVDIAGEGFDNPRSSVLVFLQLLRKNTVKAVQQAGRGIRRNYEIHVFEEDTCDMFASPDTEMAQLAVEFAERTIGEITPEENGKGKPKETTPIYDIPPFDPQVEDSEFDRSVIISKIHKAEVDKVRSGISGEYGLSAGTSVTEEMIRKVIADQKISDLEKAVNAANNPETWQKKVTGAVNVLAGNASRLRFGRSHTKGNFHDMIKVIHKKWITDSGLKTSGMFENEFRQKYEWVMGVNSGMKRDREVPRWLAL